LRDKDFVSAFLEHAEEIFATARTAGAGDCDLSILVNREGGIHVIADGGWQLESLRAHHGASVAYRVHRTNGSVRLEARSATQTCVLAAERPELGLMPPLHDFPRYLMLQ
jgi:hypothetical protein